jgi:hypothetical protein
LEAKEMTEDLEDDFLQFLMDQLNQSYTAYKRDHPDFARVVEEEQDKPYRDHCESCGEWLEGFDVCDQCGRINK